MNMRSAGLPLVSIVVPVYNVANYVVECLESIASQTYPNLEVFVVDDGSTDGSGDLVDAFAEQHRGVTVVHKENGGLSSARNVGVGLSSGEWIAFVDSDDVVSPWYVEALLSAAQKGGCSMAAVRGGFKFTDGDALVFESDRKQAFAFDVIGKADYQKELLYQKSDNGTPYRLSRAEVVKAEPFPEGYVYEDLACTYRWVRACDDIAVLRTTGLYAYRLRPDSILRCAFNENKARSCFDITGRLYEEIVDWHPDLVNAVHSRCFSVHRIVFAQAPRGSDVEREVWEGVKMHRSIVLRDCSARKRERMAAAIACLGMKPYRLFCRIYPVIQHVLEQQ